MSEKTKKKPIEEPARQAQDAAKALTAALEEIRGQGDVGTLKRIYRTLEQGLDLRVDVFSPTIAKVEAELRASRDRLGSELRAAARDANCEFKYEPPHITFGCVTLREKSPGVWELSILDGVPVETIQTVSAGKLADRALHHIEQIEAALERPEAFLEVLKAAYEILRLAAPDASRFSPNLIMLLCSSGRGLKKQLVSSDRAQARALSRAQFGFLLERVRRMRHESEATDLPTLRFEGAVVQVMNEPFRFIAIPNGIDPRSAVPSPRPVATVALTYE